MANEVAKVSEEKAVAIAAERDDFFSEMEGGDYNVPFTRILAEKSGPVQDGLCEEGTIYNTGTGEAVEVLDVVVLRRPNKSITVRGPMGDFVASHEFSKEKLAELTARQDGLKRYDSDGNGIFETWNYLIFDLATSTVSMLPMSSTNYAVAKNWNTRMRLMSQYSPTNVVWHLSVAERAKGKTKYHLFAAPTFVGTVPEDMQAVVDEAKAIYANATADYAKDASGSSAEASDY